MNTVQRHSPFTGCEKQVHPFAPVWDEQSEVLILGTFPSVQSRKNLFYYGHPQNRFWQVLASLYNAPVPDSIAQKQALLLTCRVALWDVLESCEIVGSSDASIRNATANNIAALLQKTHIRRIFCNGQKAAMLYRRYCETACGLSAIALPSTSPANAAWSAEGLTAEWRRAFTAFDPLNIG
ncbi:MAG: DNA-deoxyinosine glycosylase [Clostridia bacterium]